MKKKYYPAGICAAAILATAIGLMLFWQHETADLQTAAAEYHGESRSILLLKEYHSRAVIGAIGDILIHDWLYEDARTDGGFNFKPMFAHVKPLLSRPDFLLANQESLPGSPALEVSSYPVFCSPKEIIDALQDAGVSMVTTANNHSYDKGEAGILRAISYYEQAGLPYTGSFKNKEDQQTIRYFSTGGIRFAVLSYTYGLNGFTLPKDKPYLVNLIDKEKMLHDIQQAKRKTDLIVLSIHWGTEYERKPNAMQKELAKELVAEGADLIFGHHPHVLQPMEMIRTSNGREGIVFYSLGNFLSGQLWDYKDVGGMAEVTVEKSVLGSHISVAIKDVQFHPTFTSSTRFRSYRVYPLEEARNKGLTSITNEQINSFMSGAEH